MRLLRLTRIFWIVYAYSLDEIVAQADQFVAPRLTPQRQDPGYGVLSCGSVTDFDPSQQYSAELPGTPATPAAPATPVAH